MPEALAEAKRQLGDSVTVLHTKEYETPVMMGLAKRTCVEILATADAMAVPVPVPPAPAVKLNAVSNNILDIRDILSKAEPVSSASAREDISPVTERLVRNGVPETIASLVASECKSAIDKDEILNAIGRRIAVSGPVNTNNGQARVVLVGPTGVGKTTTAAKLAAQYTLVNKKKVALLTLDTYRISAVEQISTYAKILNIPIEVALCPEDVDPLVRKHADKDLIIIDTVGRSQRNLAHLAELAVFVRAACPTEVHLVMSASSSTAVQKEAVESFGGMSPSRMVLTKLDECPQPGCVLGLSVISLLPYSYVTHGQEVPDDIALANGSKLSKLVWEGAL
jgi:flagellar biosynthesis protein FlhF